MCGIAGYYFKEKPEEHELLKMSETMKHRGPDAEGYFMENTMGLAHRRLSIIDLSEAANQPMYSANKHFVSVYNGEVYNYKEILSTLNLQPKTSSDTEAIVEAFAKLGNGCFQHFNGMFALAVYNRNSKTLCIARDRIGIKPLFYFFDGNNLAFASELKSLMELSMVRNELKINPLSINYFLHTGYIPEPYTAFDKIYKLPAAHYMTFDGNTIDIKPYWESRSHLKAEKHKDENKAAKELKELIQSSVRYRMISDVPFGTFLSGGTDSSTVTAVAGEFSDRPINTFTIGFKESKFDESKHAAKIAAYLGTCHHEMMVSEQDALELIPDIIKTYDEPFADSSAIPTMLVSKLARKHITMVLSGDGGDELFGGYGAYRWAERLANPFIRNLRKPIGCALSQLNPRMQRAAGLFKFNRHTDLRTHIFSQEQYLFSQKEIQSLLLPPCYEIPAFNHYAFPKNTTNFEKQSFFDLNYYLKDDLLVKVDRASMKYALETRVPLLDHRIVEFSLGLHPSLKIKNKQTKYLLKKVLYGYIPEKFFQRPKWGFAIPLAVWLKTDLKYLIDQYLNDEIIRELGILNADKVSTYRKMFLGSNKDYIYNRLWAMIILNMFLIQHKSILKK